MFIIIILILLILLIGYYFYRFPGSNKIKVTRHIDASESKVFDYIINLKNWPVWVVWGVYDKDCKYVFSGELGEIGSNYIWESKLIGSGKITLVQKIANSLIDIKLEFLKPRQSSTTANFKIEAIDGGADVTWSMDLKVPYFLRFAVLKISEFISRDFAFGLERMNMLLSTNKEKYSIEFIGPTPRSSINYVSIKAESKITELAKNIKDKLKDLDKLYINNGNNYEQDYSVAPFLKVIKFDMAKDFIEFELCRAAKGSIDKHLDGYFNHDLLPSAREYLTHFKGPVEFLYHAVYFESANRMVNKKLGKDTIIFLDEFDQNNCIVNFYRNLKSE